MFVINIFTRFHKLNKNEKKKNIECVVIFSPTDSVWDSIYILHCTTKHTNTSPKNKESTSRRMCPYEIITRFIAKFFRYNMVTITLQTQTESLGRKTTTHSIEYPFQQHNPTNWIFFLVINQRWEKCFVSIIHFEVERTFRVISKE